MFIFGYLFLGLAHLVGGVCTVLTWILIARIIVSWLPIDPYHSIVQFLVQITDPILKPFRKLPLQVGMLDLSPLVAFMAIWYLNQVLTRILISIACQLEACV